MPTLNEAIDLLISKETHLSYLHPPRTDIVLATPTPPWNTSHNLWYVVIFIYLDMWCFNIQRCQMYRKIGPQHHERDCPHMMKPIQMPPKYSPKVFVIIVNDNSISNQSSISTSSTIRDMELSFSSFYKDLVVLQFCLYYHTYIVMVLWLCLL